MFEKQCNSSTQKVQDPSSGDTSTPSDPSNSTDKDSGAALDPNRTAVNPPGISEFGENLGIEFSDSLATANDGSEHPQEKHLRVHES